jgi:two-component system OmpR family sensor kinase/two-component system sensor histidine kinase BaeS
VSERWRQAGPWSLSKEERRAWRRQWRNGRGRHRRLFWRFIGALMLAAGIFLLWTASLARVVARITGLGDAGSAASWVAALIAAILLPAGIIVLVRYGFSRLIVPLSDLVQAADAVAAGDLSVRVEETGRGGLGRLAQSFNRMTSELERADRRRRNLTADVAHELRTPLHIIQGNLEGVLDGVYEPTDEHIRATLAETRSLGRLIEDLRVLSLAEAGELPLTREVVDVGDLLADVGTSFSGQAESQGVMLTVEPLSAPLRVTADPGRLDQVLSNLVANALRPTPAGGQVALAARDRDDKVQIWVSDTGEGISEADLPYVFDRFWRGDRSRDRSAGQSGLGLAIARQLARAHGGELEVTSKPGTGATFTLMLPKEAPTLQAS